MKKLVGKMVKGIVGIGCIASLCVALNGESSVSMNDGKKVQAEPIGQVQEVDKKDSKKTIDSINDGEKGIIIKAENWLHEEDDENKDLDGNVIVEDGNKVIEISKDTYDEVEHGENSDLTGDVYLGEDDIINVTTKEDSDNDSDNELYHQVKSVEELKNNFNKFNVIDSKNDDILYTVTLNNGIVVTYDYDSDMFYVNDGKSTEDFESIEDTEKYIDKVLRSKYDDYKNSLISQYGEDIYNLMNQEAGVENEEQSFQHYVEYGI